MIEYRYIMISSLILNTLVIKDLVAYNFSDNFFKYITIGINILIILIVLYDILILSRGKRYDHIR